MTKRRPPMTDAEHQDYLDEVNRRAEPFIPLVNCHRCGKPIVDRHVIHTSFDPPLWFHLECDLG